MLQSEELFHLIHGLSKTEKGYVVKFLSTFHSKETNSIKMYKYVSQQKKPNDKELRSVLNNIKSDGAFSVAKNYLFKLILKALENYHLDNNIDLYIRHHLNQANLLFEKGRNKSSYKILDKIKKIANEYQLYVTLLEILSMQRKLAMKMLDFSKTQELIYEEDIVLGLYTQTKKYRDLAEDAMRKFFSAEGDEAQKYEMENIIGHESLQNYNLATTFLSKKNFLTIFAFYYYSINQPDISYDYSKRRLDLFYENHFSLKYYSRDFLASLNNVLYIGYLLRRLNELKSHLAKVGEAKEFLINPNDLATVFYLNYHLLNYYNAVGDFKTSSIHCDTILNEYEEKSKLLNSNEKLVLQLHAAYSYFGNNQFRKSVFWLNRIKTSGKLDQNPEAQAFHTIFYLINHYELGNHELVFQMINSNNRALQKLKSFNELQLNIIELLSKATKVQKRRDHLELFKQLMLNIENSSLKTPASGVFEDFDFVSWIQSKIEGRPFSEIVKSRVREASSI